MVLGRPQIEHTPQLQRCEKMCTIELMKYTFSCVCDFSSVLIYPLLEVLDLANGNFIDHFGTKVLRFMGGG